MRTEHSDPSAPASDAKETAGPAAPDDGTARTTEHRPATHVALLTGAVLLLALGAALSLCVGAQGIEPAEVWRGLLGTADGEAGTIVREVRVPRTVLAVAVGAALAVAGALIQTLTRNPLAEPGLLGVTAGAGFAMTLGAALGLVGTEAGELALAATGALLAALLVFTVGRTSPLRLVLTGVALTAVLTGVSVGLRVTLPDVLDSYRFWSVGALAGREQADLAPLLVLIGCCLAATVPLAGSLGAIALGEHVAHTLGVRVARVRLAVLALITLLTGAATAAAGPIVFVGLVVPHLARRAAGGSVRLLIGYTMLLGPVLMLLADVGARVLLPVGELPVAVVTAFVGGPVLIWAVRRYGAVAL